MRRAARHRKHQPRQRESQCETLVNFAGLVDRPASGGEFAAAPGRILYRQSRKKAGDVNPPLFSLRQTLIHKHRVQALDQRLFQIWQNAKLVQHTQDARHVDQAEGVRQSHVGE